MREKISRQFIAFVASNNNLSLQLAELRQHRITNLRRDMIQEIEKLEKSRVISEDDKNKGKKNAEEMLHKFEKQLTDLITHKEKEIMEV